MSYPHESSLFCEVKYTLPIGVAAQVANYVAQLMLPTASATPTPPPPPPQQKAWGPPGKRHQKATNNNCAARRVTSKKEPSKTKRDADEESVSPIIETSKLPDKQVQVPAEGSTRKAAPTKNDSKTNSNADSDDDTVISVSIPITNKFAALEAQAEKARKAQKAQKAAEEDIIVQAFVDETNESQDAFTDQYVNRGPNNIHCGDFLARRTKVKAQYKCRHGKSDDICVAIQGAIAAKSYHSVKPACHIDEYLMMPTQIQKYHLQGHTEFGYVMSVAAHLLTRERAMKHFRVSDLFVAHHENKLGEYLDSLLKQGN